MMKAVRAKVVLKVTTGIWMAIYFKTASRSAVGNLVKSVPKPCFTDRVKKTVDAIARH